MDRKMTKTWRHCRTCVACKCDTSEQAV